MSTPDLSTVIMDAIKYQLAETNTAIPARILDYDPATQSASVEPLIKKRYKDGRVIDRAPITGVPVIFPAAGGGIITFPVKEGDTVLLIFSQRSIDRWVQSDGQPIDPLDNRKHDISDAIALPGLFNFSSALQSDPDNVIIKFSGAEFVMTPEGAIEINAPGGLTVNGDTQFNGDQATAGSIDATDEIHSDDDVTGPNISLETHTHAGSPTAPSGVVSPTGEPI